MDASPVSLPGRPPPPPLALYVHFPWCESKCPYCDFNSHEAGGEVPEADYLEAVRLDLESCAAVLAGRKVASVYIGGGTPSLMSARGLDKLLSDIRMLVHLRPLAEVTMEANPGSCDASRFGEYAKAGVNRLSLGIQTLSDDALARLGRVHDAAQAMAAAQEALRCFERVNLDLMFGLPGQTLAAARRDVRQACALGAGHLSCYQLTLELGTRFYRRPPDGMPDDELVADMDDMVRDELGGAGQRRYEVSAHCKPGQECLHNLNYWRFGDYVGVGAGAHSKVTGLGGVRREVRHKSPGRYVKGARAGDAVATRWTVGRRDLAFEFMLNALRLVDGFDERLFAERTGLAISEVAETLGSAQDAGWVVRGGGVVRPTQAGLDRNADLCSLFMPDGKAVSVGAGA